MFQIKFVPKNKRIQFFFETLIEEKKLASLLKKPDLIDRRYIERMTEPYLI
jgi:hypothetical protein